MANRRLAPAAEQPADLRVLARERRMGQGPDREVPGGPPGLGGDPAAVEGAGAERRLAAAEGDRGGGRRARHAAYPRARGRDLLHDVRPRAGGPVLDPALRHGAVRFLRRARAEGLPAAAASARRATSAPTATSPGSRSSAWAPAATRRWCRSTRITTRT